MATPTTPGGRTFRDPDDDYPGRRTMRRAPLGADNRTPYHDFRPPMTVLRYKDLQRNGYINYRPRDQEGIEYSNSVPPQDKLPPVDMFLPGCTSGMAIHPIFSHWDWGDRPIADEEYELLKPALRLATCFLENDSILPLLTAIVGTGQHTEIIDDRERVTLRLGRLRRINLIPLGAWTGHAASHAATRRTLLGLGEDILWRIGTSDETPWGQTQKQSDHVCIGISVDYINVIAGHVDVRGFPKASDVDPEAALLRTYFQLAGTLMHEISHAAYLLRSRFKSSLEPVLENDVVEPFLGNDRVAELGYAMECIIFGHALLPTGFNCRLLADGTGYCSSSAPYGFQAYSWPDSGLGTGPDFPSFLEPALASARFWGERYDYWFPLQMSEIFKYFTQDFWLKEVPQNGPAALKLATPIVVTNAASDFLFPNEVDDMNLFFPNDPIVQRSPTFPIMQPKQLRSMGFRPRPTKWVLDNPEWETDSDVSDGGTRSTPRKKQKRFPARLPNPNVPPITWAPMPY